MNQTGSAMQKYWKNKKSQREVKPSRLLKSVRIMNGYNNGYTERFHERKYSAFIDWTVGVTVGWNL